MSDKTGNESECIHWLPTNIGLFATTLYFILSFSIVYISKYFSSILKAHVKLTNYLVVLPVVVSSGSNIAMQTLSQVQYQEEKNPQCYEKIFSSILPQLVSQTLIYSLCLSFATYIGTYFLNSSANLVWVTTLTILTSSLLVTILAILYPIFISHFVPQIKNLTGSLLILSNDISTTLIFFLYTLWFNKK